MTGGSGGIGPDRWLLPVLVLVGAMTWPGSGRTSPPSGTLSRGDAAPVPQEAEQEAPPRLPAGVPVVFLPLQSVGGAPDGGWPGVDGDRGIVLARFDDEIGFALDQRRATRAWVAPGRVVQVAERNPMLDVDPRALAYQGIRNERDDPLYEPLHGQLRSLTALLDARLVVLPFALRYETGAAAGDTAPQRGDRDVDPPGRPTLEVAIIDTRAGRILWVGAVEGAAAAPGSSGMLAKLADRLVRRLAPS